MRASDLFFPTLREAPSDAELASHQLLLRGGFLRSISAGVFAYLPLGLRVLRKAEQIVREEMNRIGGQEVHLSVLQPAELWRETGRWDTFQPPLFKLKDRVGRDFCLGPTHEEEFTDIVRHEVRSYRQLPLILYQIQVKFRDELRPRGGLIRTKEFLMKDAYSFHATKESLDEVYERMYEAYVHSFERCGLKCEVVEAGAGSMGGYETREFMVLADSGEDSLLLCEHCDYAANAQYAQVWPPDGQEPQVAQSRAELKETPQRRTIEQVTEFLGLPAERLVKTLIFRSAQGGFLAGLVRGDRDLNLDKLAEAAQMGAIEMASPEEIMGLTGAPVGFSGPVGLPDGVRTIADHEIRYMQDAVVGANQDDAHLVNVNVGVDFQPQQYADIRVAQDGDRCGKCGQGRFQLKRGIELGHIFKLGTKYAEDLGAVFTDEHGVEKPMTMGCYGFGVSRILSAVVETSHDQDGIIWPMGLAPFHVAVLLLDPEPALRAEAESLAQGLEQAGLEVLLDDRDERPGVKFKDADLIGIPLKAVIGRHTKATGEIEIQTRADGSKEAVAAAQAVSALRQRVEAALSGGPSAGQQ